ncbi:MAG: Fic family protein [Bacillota bacterium]
MAEWQLNFNARIDVRSPEITSLIVELEAFRRSILRIPLPPEMRKRFDRINIVRQIRGTTGIEGNTLTEDRIEQVLENAGKSQDGPARSLEETEVLNAAKACEYTRQYVKSNESNTISEDLVRTFHRLLTHGCDYPNNVPGEYRRHGSTVGDYRAPDHQEIEDLMRRFLDFIDSPAVVEGYGPLIRAVLAHFYLVSVHPFADGNGRTSRAVEAFILCQGGYNTIGFYSLANYYHRNRSKYIDMLQRARFIHDTDLTEFVGFSLRGFVEELKQIQEEILDYVKRALFRSCVSEAVEVGRINSRQMAILEQLAFYERDGIPAEAFRNRNHHLVKAVYEDKTNKTLMRDLQTLKDLRFIAIRESRIVANLDLLHE